jgi:extradiol dioxygenase family protein
MQNRRPRAEVKHLEVVMPVHAYLALSALVEKENVEWTRHIKVPHVYPLSIDVWFDE